jgi:alpha-glucoside transport system substrate-binding protein
MNGAGLQTYTVTVLIQGGEQDEIDFEAAVESFEAQSSINVVFEALPNIENEIFDRLESSNPPDASIVVQPSLLDELVAAGYTIDLNQWFNQAYLQGQYDQFWLDLSDYEGELSGVWYRINPKSIVYYPLPEFTDAGYQVPQTWTEMLTLTQQIAASGTTPWCVGIESGGATGWVGTDWVEDIMLRTTSTISYDQWVDGALLFNSPEVRNAFETMAEIWFNDDYVYGGRSQIPNIHFGDAPLPMFDDPPGCFLHRQGTFIPLFFPEGTQYGVDYDYFYLPPIDAQYGTPVLVAGDQFAAFADRYEVKEFLRYLTTGESVKYFIQNQTWVSPHEDTPLNWYPQENKGYAEIIANASTFRFDGSDLMPSEVGAGTFWQGITDYVNGTDLDTVLNTIDASWP